jgi:16S rRNA (uracil1498-N3)-methyltransferase
VYLANVMQLFYGQIENGFARLADDEARHASRVLRKQVGDEIQVLDGSGSLFTCVITGAENKAIIARVQGEQKNFGPVPYELHLAIAPTKNSDRMEWLVEKATEMGVTSIRLFTSANSERRRVREDRLQRILRAAAKQSLKGKVPRLHPLESFEKVIASSNIAQKFIAHCHDHEKNEFSKVLDVRQAVEILIGPEGDFNPPEVEVALAAGYQPVALGNSRLRTETAGLVAVAAVYTAYFS